MLIHGLQKMTLLDYPGYVACTVFLNGCDFRCPYCHNFELVDGTAQALMDDEEFFAFLGKRKGLLDGVCISGGEPLLHKDIDDFIRRIREMGFKVKLDTNGYHPDMLKKLIDEGLLDYIAMDIKNSFAKYAVTTGAPNINTSIIKKSISIIMNSGVDYEFRTTVAGGLHQADDFEQIGAMIPDAKAYYLQQFTMRDTVPDRELYSPSAEEMDTFLKIVKKHVDSAQLRGVSD
ncbi:MAG: anaerobic ribonucleoside-triphosphate reductase activating protein [Butyrivibrio sp.]|uniref:anaerobic ribonucleoside-triphosphate reductase activating protein n=1 Tax=Butyrivibrio sp. TaxID=28121 RepID=UPI001B54E0C7|nr:anaerobic ribonucleoside-triphosphate reductase activating protein [Butyrivibrio sp.]MBP3279382.1 anaerobic ribonucleoside-triphosphate reductase activating protein [Butyrivibrio sp.]MBP3784778.1 anaerobic ribonucleoside-triphosphate reductase activating protein [Butyrivibrio sp.]